MAEHNEFRGQNEPREKELDVSLNVVEQLADLKRRMMHLETLETPEGSVSDFVALDKAELTIDTATVTFASISGDFVALKIVGYIRTDAAADFDELTINFNNDVGSNYDYRLILQKAARATAANAGGSNILVGRIAGDTAPSNVFGALEFIIPSYENALNQKTLVGMSSNRETNFSGGLMVSTFVGFWRDNSPITEIDIAANGGSNIMSGSNIYLYGLRASS